MVSYKKKERLISKEGEKEEKIKRTKGKRGGR